ncbi:MAG: ATP-binding protein [bacterium]|nr:ATP-binding protein [bacterium]
MNPCPCGYYPERNLCNCTEHQVKKYLSKISKPFLDRVDIITEANKVNHKELQKKGKEESSKVIWERVRQAREIQYDRYKSEKIFFNAQLTPRMIKKFCVLEEEEEKFLALMFERMNLSARAYHRILKVARTIADLEGEERINKMHLSEAVCYRSVDEKYWGEKEWSK